MPQRTGTHDISTLLATRNVSAVEFGMDTIQEVLNADLEVHNQLMQEAMSEIADITLDRQRISGGSVTIAAKRVDEYGRGPTQRQAQNAQVAFPVELFQIPIGWTRNWEKKKTPADFAITATAAQQAHRAQILAEIKRALLLSANYTFQDDLNDNIDLAVKRLLNADGATIPNGPNGEVFDPATHTHYLANATLTTAAVDSLITTVVEHGHGGKVRIYINKANETAFKALTGFMIYQDPRIILATNANAANERADITRLDNRAIGIYGAAEVWVKPWMPASYAFCFDVDTANKPVVLREDTAGSMNLAIAAEIDAHPLVAQYMEFRVGAGVWTRTNGAVLYFAGGAYVDPAITLP